MCKYRKIAVYRAWKCSETPQFAFFLLLTSVLLLSIIEFCEFEFLEQYLKPKIHQNHLK